MVSSKLSTMLKSHLNGGLKDFGIVDNDYNNFVASTSRDRCSSERSFESRGLRLIGRGSSFFARAVLAEAVDSP
ncbi:hypothetical protein XHV734_0097 [Xanthomonas hortorum pv. vitians]|nr:hypothetical protein XHV734_0097 [Xanthomonas hortorum pv. vitians]